MTGSPKLLYFLNSFDRGGAEIGLTRLVSGGLFKGFDLTIAAIARGNGGIEERLTDLGYKTIFFSDAKKMSFADVISSYFKLLKLISQINPDIVIGSLPQANIVARLACALKKRILFISFEHNTHLAKRIYEIAFLATSYRVDWTFADANFTLDAAQERLYLFRPANSSIVPLVNFDKPSIEYTRDGNSNAYHFINTGRFTLVKNQRAIVEALSIIRLRGRDVSLTLYGEGEHREECKLFVENLGLSPFVTFPGFIEDWASHPSDGFILASHHEGLCIVLLEAMHAGIPVVAPIVGGINDYGNNQNILALPSVAPSAIADGIEQFITNKPETALRAMKAGQTIEYKYGQAAIKKQLAAINLLMHTRVCN